MVTLKDVAREVGVSTTTVSYVLNGTGSVSKKVQTKVRAAAKKLGYVPDRNAQAMRTGFTKSIGLMIPDLTNPYFPELAQRVGNAAGRNGLSVVLFDSQGQIESEEEGFRVLGQHRVDGIIWCPAHNTLPTNIHTVTCPIVAAVRSVDGYDVVRSDDRKGGVLQARCVNASGHKKVGLLAGPRNLDSARHRREGFYSEISDSISVVWDVEVPFSMALSDEARQHLDAHEATMLVCANDMIAIGVIDYLDNEGYTAPQDFSVIGFDNIPWTSVVRPKLTTIAQAIKELGTEAVNMLVQRIHSQDKKVKSVLIDVELLERDSVRNL